MAEQRLIDANAVLEWLEDITEPQEWLVSQYNASWIFSVIDSQPTVDSVSRGVHDQVRWERDVAIGQLEEHGIPFGGIAPDVVKVLRCKDCKHWKDDILSDDQKICEIGFYFIDGNGFCSYGERRTDNERKAD